MTGGTFAIFPAPYVSLLATTANDSKYLQIARTFVDTMIEKGTDRYGSVHSPLFAAMLDLETLSLPVIDFPEEFFRTSNGQIQGVGYRLPNPPVGIRPGDRAPLGNNLEHDAVLLAAMYELSKLTGEPKYTAHADAYLRFWLENCQSPATGLPASGEHMSWDFVRERAYGNVHEVFRRFPLYDKLYSIDPYRTLKIADALWVSQIGNKKVADFSRHAGYESYKPGLGAAYPRHAGFYIWAYANAYVASRDPKYIHRIEVHIESRTGKRLYPESLLVEPGSFQPEKSTDLTLRMCLWDAAELVPERRAAWRAVVRELDEEALAEPEPELRRTIGRPRTPEEQAKFQRDYPGALRYGRVATAGGVFTTSTTVGPLWLMGYGNAGASGLALQYTSHYRRTRDDRFLRRAERIADQYVAERMPSQTHDLWPKATGQVISLMLALAGEAAIAPAKRKGYESFAIEVADASIRLFSRNGLFRADGAAEHYEAITGADDLVWALLQLHSRLSLPDRALGHVDANW